MAEDSTSVVVTATVVSSSFLGYVSGFGLSGNDPIWATPRAETGDAPTELTFPYTLYTAHVDGMVLGDGHVVLGGDVTIMVMGRCGSSQGCNAGDPCTDNLPMPMPRMGDQDFWVLDDVTPTGSEDHIYTPQWGALGRFDLTGDVVKVGSCPAQDLSFGDDDPDYPYAPDEFLSGISEAMSGW